MGLQYPTAPKLDQLYKCVHLLRLTKKQIKEGEGQ